MFNRKNKEEMEVLDAKITLLERKVDDLFSLNVQLQTETNIARKTIHIIYKRIFDTEVAKHTIKNCPFCDLKGYAEYHVHGKLDHGQYILNKNDSNEFDNFTYLDYTVSCKNKACSVSPKTKAYNTLQEAVNRWNSEFPNV